MELVSSLKKAKKNTFNFVRNNLGSFLPFRGSNLAWKSEPLHLNNWVASLDFVLYNQFNQVYQMGLIKAHPFLLSSHSTYQWKLVSQLVTSFCKNRFSYLLCKFQDKTFFSLFSQMFFILLPLFTFILSFSCKNFVAFPLVMITKS